MSSLREDSLKSSNYIDGQVRRIRDNELRPQNHIGFQDNRFRNVRFEKDALLAGNAYSVFYFLNIMEDTYTAICIYSFNSRGFGDDKQDICRLLMLENENFVPILCNQENFSYSIIDIV